MKKIFLIAFAFLFSVGVNAQNRVTSVASNDIMSLASPSGISRKTITVGNFMNGIEIGGGTPAAGSFTTLLLGNGTVGLPSLSFTSDADNGIYRIGINNIGIAAAGAKVLDIATTGLAVTGVLSTTGLLSPAAAINNSAGTAGAPSYSYTNQPDMGRFLFSAVQEGQSIGGILVGGWNSAGLFTGNITEQVTGAGITFAKQTIQLRTAATYTVDSTITAASLAKGLLVISSGTVTLTLPTATNIGTQLGATAGTTFDFVLQNSASGGTATIAVNTGIVASGFPATNTLTLGNSATIGIATFRLTFISATAATLTRTS